MLHTLAVSNYRSLRNFVAPLGELTLITGPNGSGKSNVYRASPMVGPFGLPALARHRRVRRASPTRLSDLGRRVLRSVATSLSQSVLESCLTGKSHPGGLFSGCASTEPASGVPLNLARLIGVAAKSAQIFVVSHATRLIAALKENSACLSIELDKQLSETQILGQGNLDVPSWHWLSR
jgi:hypothetical protein